MPAELTMSSRSRLTSWSLVAGLHGLLILGLSAGLIRGALQPPPGPTQVRVVDEPDLPPPAPVPLPPQATAQVRMPLLPPMPLPPIDIVQSAPSISVLPLTPDAPPLREPQAPARAAEASATPAAASGPQAAGLLCPTQVRPQVPGLATEGSAQLRVLATVQGGRVVGVQLQTLRALPERRAQRALLAEVEQALRTGYRCTQDGVFEQEFLFRVE